MTSSIRWGLSVALAAGAMACSPALSGRGTGLYPGLSAFVPPPLILEWRTELVTSTVLAWSPIERGAPGLDPAQDRLFVGASDGYARALRGSDGSTLWSMPVRGGVQGEAVYDAENDWVLFGSDGGVLHAFRASTGETAWSRNLRGVVRQPPLLGPEVLYVATGDDTVAALARADGRLLWRYRREPREGFGVEGYAGLTLDGPRLLTSFSDGAIVALVASDGTVAWARETASDLDEAGEDSSETTAGRFYDADATPIAHDGLVFAASFGGGLYALQATNGRPVWRRAELGGVTGLLAAGEHLIVASASEGLLALNPRTGATRWQQRIVDRGAPTTPANHRGLLVVGFSGGGMAVLRADTGALLQSFDMGRGAAGRVVAYRGRVFVLSNAGYLWAFRFR